MNTFQLQPATPDMAQLRAAARDIMEASAFDKAAAEEMDAAHSYAELTADDLRELLDVGDTVRYHRQSYGFLDGTVTQVDLQTDRAEIRFDDEWGVRKHWCALSYLQLLLKREAAALSAGKGVAGRNENSSRK